MDFKFLFFLCFLFASCNPQTRIAGNYSYKTECLYLESSGSIVVKGWGKGLNKIDAIENAKKNALEELILLGIHNGKSDCGTRPLVLKINAKEHYQDFFNDFFGKKAIYKRYVSRAKGGLKTLPERKGGRGFVTFGVVLKIELEELKEYLKKKNIT